MRKTFIAIALVAVVALVAGPATAGGRGGGKGKPGSGGSSSLTLVLLDGATEAHHGGRVTFTVSTTATDRPFVSVNCYDGGTWVYSASAGFFPDYPWSRDFTLATTSWTSGPADCVAKLYTTRDGTRITTLATLDFHTYA